MDLSKQYEELVYHRNQILNKLYDCQAEIKRQTSELEKDTQTIKDLEKELKAIEIQQSILDVLPTSSGKKSPELYKKNSLKRRSPKSPPKASSSRNLSRSPPRKSHATGIEREFYRLSLNNPSECVPDGNGLKCTEYKTITLKEHQQKVCIELLERGLKRLLFFHSVGSGKTITAITAIRCIQERHPRKNVFIVTPKSLLHNFYKEMAKLKINISRLSMYTHQEFVNRVKKEGPAFATNSIMIIDEVHHFKTRIKEKEDLGMSLITEGVNAYNIMKATSVADFVFLLTATPLMNSIEEFTNLYAILSNKEKDIKILYRQFKETAPEIMVELLKNKVHYFKNSDRTEYPSLSIKEIKFRMTPEYYSLYKKIEEDNPNFRYIYNVSNMAVFLNGIRRAVNYIDNTMPTPKTDWATDFISSETKAGRKTLIYSNWLESGLRLIQDRLTQKGIPWIEITGKMTPLQRKKGIDAYNNGQAKNLFISSAGSEGLDLKETRNVIIMEPHWNNERINQVIGRAVRYKSHANLPKEQRHVDVYMLLLEKPAHINDDFPSADIKLRELSLMKAEHIEEFYKNIAKASL